MRNKWTKKEMDVVDKMIEKYLSALRLDNWKVEVSFLNEYSENDNDESIVTGEISSNITYTKAYLTLYKTTLERWDKLGLKGLEDIIKHELCHMMTEQLYLFALERHITNRELTHAREKLTEHISKLI